MTRSGLAVLPDGRRLLELGLSEGTVLGWVGLSRSGAYAPAVIATLEAALTKVLQRPELREHRAAQGANVAVQSSAAYAQFVSDEAARWKQVVQAGRNSARNRPPIEVEPKGQTRPCRASQAGDAAGTSPRRGKLCVRKETPRHFSNARSIFWELWEPRIGARLHQSAAARAAAEPIDRRWRAGKPLFADSTAMPVGIKDIIETVDMPTEMAPPLFSGWRFRKTPQRARAARWPDAVIVGKTVTTEFAASNRAAPQSLETPRNTPGGSSSGSAAAVAAGIRQRGARTQVIRLDHPAGELLRLRCYKRRTQSTAKAATILKARAAPASRRHLEDVCSRARDRRPGPARRRHARACKAPTRPRGGETAPPCGAGNRRLGQRLGRARQRLGGCGRGLQIRPHRNPHPA